MLVNITEYFIESGREWQVGQNPDVPREVAARWIADGKATADTDGARNQFPVSGGSRIKYLAAAIGDSRFANSLQDQSTATPQVRVNWSNQGALFWLNFLTYQVIDLPYTYDKAVSGATTADIANQVVGILALLPRPSICFINGGTNSFAAASTYAQVLASYADITSAANVLMAAGITPVIEVDAPRTVASWSANARSCSIAYNKLIRQWCRDNGVRCADSESMMVQVSGASAGDPVAGYNVADGVHQSCSGAIVRGLAIQAALSGMLPTWGQQSSNPLDLYDATYNPGGNLITVGQMLGTAGANSGSGASGACPTGWTNQVVSGTATCVASKESQRNDARMGDAAVQTIVATTASVTRFAPTGGITTTGKLAAGDVVFGEIDCELSALSGTVDYAQLNVFDFDGAVSGSLSIAGKNTFASGLNPLPALPMARNSGGTLLSTLRGRLRTAPITIGQGITSTTVHFRAEVGLAAGASTTVKWGDAILRKVVS